MASETTFEWPRHTVGGPATTPLRAADCVLETQSSVWVVRLDGFLRLPRDGEFRDGAPLSVDDIKFVDGALVPFREIYFRNVGIGWVLQAVPSDRPKGAEGIQSGNILRASIRPPEVSYSG